MIFTEITENKTNIHIDGYSNKKTIKGAIKDLAREVAKISELESKALTDNMEYTIAILNHAGMRREGNYFIECEEVSCAAKYINDYEAEYKEANFYLHLCMSK